MAHTQETRDRVRRLYIEGMPLTAAAATAGVSYDSARDWQAKARAKGDDWDTARTAYSVSDQGIDSLNKQLVEEFARNVIVTTRELENSTQIHAGEKAQLLAQLADAYSKFSKSFSRLNPQFSGLSVALDTLKIIVAFLKEHDPETLRALYVHLDAIGAILGKRHG